MIDPNELTHVGGFAAHQCGDAAELEASTPIESPAPDAIETPAEDQP